MEPPQQLTSPLTEGFRRLSLAVGVLSSFIVMVWFLATTDLRYPYVILPLLILMGLAFSLVRLGHCWI
jgi:hypothetical protein